MSHISILMYHDVRNPQDSPFPNRYIEKATRSVNVDDFKNQIHYIKHNYCIITIEELMYIIASGKSNNNYAVLTFDDGLKDHVKVGEILHDMKLPAVFFVPSEPVLKRKMMKTHKIQFIIGEQSFKIIKDEIMSNFSEEEQKTLWQTYSKSSWKNNTWTPEQVFITNFLRRYTDKGKSKKICHKLFMKHVTRDEHDLCNDFYLTMKDVKDLWRAGFTIGGHGYTSENLLDYHGKSLTDEFDKMTRFIKAIHDQNLYMSYPNGGFNDEIVKEVNDRQYTAAFATMDRNIEDLKSESPYYLPRLDAVKHLEGK